MRLTTKQIQNGLQQGKPLSPLYITDEYLDQQLETIGKQRLESRIEDEPSRQLKRSIHAALEFVSPKYKQCLNSDIPLFCLPLALCEAYSEVENAQGRIVICQGLIDWIHYGIACAHFIGELPNELDEKHSTHYRPDMSLKELMINTLLLYSLRFYCYGEALPDIWSLLNNAAKQATITAGSGATLFVVLHELGHIKLGHFNDEQITRPHQWSSLIQENTNTIMQEEMDADNFAEDALIKDARILAPYWRSQSLNPIIQLELVSGMSNETHPLALNRSFQSFNNREEHTNDGHWNSLAENYKSTQQWSPDGQNPFIHTNKAGCDVVFLHLAEILKRQYSIDIRASITNHWQSWCQLER